MPLAEGLLVRYWQAVHDASPEAPVVLPRAHWVSAPRSVSWDTSALGNRTHPVRDGGTHLCVGSCAVGLWACGCTRVHVHHVCGMCACSSATVHMCVLMLLLPELPQCIHHRSYGRGGRGLCLVTMGLFWG